MAKVKAKTIETTERVADFITTVADHTKQQDCIRISEIMKQQSGFEPKMWGPAIIGFGTYHYKYESGQEGDAPIVAFSPRKNAITLYLNLNPQEKIELLKDFGKHKISKGCCIYIKQLEGINIPVLKKMITISIRNMKKKYK